MNKKLTVSYSPFIHYEKGINYRNLHIILAALPAFINSVFIYGISVFYVVFLSVSSGILWEALITLLRKEKQKIDDLSAASISLIFAMLLPATAPWWLIITGTFFAVIIGKEIYGGLGANPFNPVALSFAILMLSWKPYLDFNSALINYEFPFSHFYPLSYLAYFQDSSVFSLVDLFLGKQLGGIGATCGLGIVLGGIYLILRGFIRWEISLSFVIGILITGAMFHLVNPVKYPAGGLFHLLTGFSLVSAFFLSTESASSPVNFIPMLIYGFLGGFLTVLIRNIGADWIDGAIFAVLLINILNPILDNIRAKVISNI